MECGRNEVGSDTEDRAEPARGSARERRETIGIRSEGREGRRQGIREHHTVVGDALPENEQKANGIYNVFGIWDRARSCPIGHGLAY